MKLYLFWKKGCKDLDSLFLDPYLANTWKINCQKLSTAYFFNYVFILRPLIFNHFLQRKVS